MDVAHLREHARTLRFTPQDQVRWFAPGAMLRTATEVLASTTFAGYLDRREIQTGLGAQIALGLTDSDLWLDYVSDLGDGFDPTFTVASLIAAPELEVDGPDGALTLPRGSALVMGGDEVYPTPAARRYEDRLRGPYRAALPREEVPEGGGPMLLALPGNHDWYDGLTAFLRLFCQRRPIGGWRTVQTRSYFVVDLGFGWWLAGVDTQLGTYIDQPQIDYFREHLSRYLQPGHGVILCVPEPMWAKVDHDPDAFNTLDWFEQNVVRTHVGVDGDRRETGAQVRLWLSGDLHHYARYTSAPTGTGSGQAEGQARQFVTCGLGGAYLGSTDDLPERVTVPPEASRRGPDVTERTDLRLAARYPEPGVTERLARGVVSAGPAGMPLRNPGFWRLAGTLHAGLLLALVGLLALERRLSPVEAIRQAGPGDVLDMLGRTMVLSLVVGVFYAVGLLIRRGRPRRVLGGEGARVALDLVVGGVLQALLAFGTLVLVVALPWPSWPSWVVLTLLLVFSLVVVGLLSSYLFGGSILLARSRLVRSWRMAAVSVEDHKGFLRLQFAPDGSSVTVHPVVVDRVHRDWAVDGDRPVPVGDLPRPRLAERPFRVDRQPDGVAPEVIGEHPQDVVPDGCVPGGGVPEGTGGGPCAADRPAQPPPGQA